jgi:hypothetical protein
MKWLGTRKLLHCRQDTQLKTHCMKTLGIKTLSIKTLNVMTLNIKALIVKTLRIKTDSQPKDTWYINTA